MNKDDKKKAIMKKLLASKGKGGPGSGSAGQYSIDDPTKAAMNLDDGGVKDPTKPTPNPTAGFPIEDRKPQFNGKGGPGYAPQTPFAKAKLPKVEMEGKGGPGSTNPNDPSNYGPDMKGAYNNAKKTGTLGVGFGEPSSLGASVKNATSPSRFSTLSKMPDAPMKSAPDMAKKMMLKKAMKKQPAQMAGTPGDNMA